MTKYLYVSEDTTTSGCKALNYIKITNKTIKEYSKVKGSKNLLCIGNHWLLSLYKFDELKELLLNEYQHISKDYILEY